MRVQKSRYTTKYLDINTKDYVNTASPFYKVLYNNKNVQEKPLFTSVKV